MTTIEKLEQLREARKSLVDKLLNVQTDFAVEKWFTFRKNSNKLLFLLMMHLLIIDVGYNSVQNSENLYQIKVSSFESLLNLRALNVRAGLQTYWINYRTTYNQEAAKGTSRDLDAVMFNDCRIDRNLLQQIVDNLCSSWNAMVDIKGTLFARANRKNEIAEVKDFLLTSLFNEENYSECLGDKLVPLTDTDILAVYPEHMINSKPVSLKENKSTMNYEELKQLKEQKIRDITTETNKAVQAIVNNNSVVKVIKEHCDAINDLVKKETNGEIEEYVLLENHSRSIFLNKEEHNEIKQLQNSAKEKQEVVERQFKEMVSLLNEATTLQHKIKILIAYKYASEVLTTLELQ